MPVQSATSHPAEKTSRHDPAGNCQTSRYALFL